MNLMDIINKEFLVESNYLRKTLKVFYEIDLNLIKPTEQAEQPAAPANNNQVNTPNVQAPAEQPPVGTAETNPAPEQQEEPLPSTPENEPEPLPKSTEDEPEPLPKSPDEEGEKENSSVVSEEDEGEKILRKAEGELSLSDSQKDNIQSFGDIISILNETKEKGDLILDDFSYEIIELCSNQKFDEIKTKVDKKSKIFFELYYGYNKNDSIGVRFSKRPNSDTMTYTMMVDNEIVNAKFDITRVDSKITEYRNYEAKK